MPGVVAVEPAVSRIAFRIHVLALEIAWITRRARLAVSFVAPEGALDVFALHGVQAAGEDAASSIDVAAPCAI